MKETDDEGRWAAPTKPLRPRAPRGTVVAAALFATVALAYLAVVWQPSGLDRLHAGAPRAELTGAGPSAEVPISGAPLRLAVAPVVSPEESLQLYEDLARYLGRALGRPGELLLRPSYAEVNLLVRQRACDVAFVCTWAFIQGERDFGMQAIVVPVVDGHATYRSFIIVPKDSNATSLLDLGGSRFGSGDLLSTSGWLWAALQVKKSGNDPDSFFGKHVVTGSHDRSVWAVASGLIDAAAVDSLVYEQVTAKHTTVRLGTKVVHMSEPFGNPPLVVHPSLDPSTRATVLAALIEMHKEPEGRAILDALGFDWFQTPEPDTWDGVRTMVQEWEERP